MSATTTLERPDVSTKSLAANQQLIDAIVSMLPEYDHDLFAAFLKKRPHAVDLAIESLEDDFKRAFDAWAADTYESDNQTALSLGLDVDSYASVVASAKFMIADQLVGQMFNASGCIMNPQGSIFRLGLHIELVITAVFDKVYSIEQLTTECGQLYEGADLYEVIARLAKLGIADNVAP